MYFSEAGTSGRVIDKPVDAAQATGQINAGGSKTAIGLETIDHVLQGQRATMIKMDIEPQDLIRMDMIKKVMT